MKHTSKRIDKNTVEYRGYEITKCPHLKGYHGHYKIGSKKAFSLMSEAKAWVDTQVGE